MNQESSSLPASRAKALLIGAKTYFTGKPCPNGGVAERRADKGECLCRTCRDIKAAHAKRRREEKPDVVLGDKRRRYQENRDSLIAYARQYRNANREQILEKRRSNYRQNRLVMIDRSKRYHDKNRDLVLSRKSHYYHQNRDDLLKDQRQYRSKNKHIISAISANRRAVKKKRIPSFFSEFDAFVWKEAHDLRLLRNNLTGFEWHCDHMIPMECKAASGLHVGLNCQVIPSKMNISKKNKMILTEPGQWINAL